MRIVNIFVCMCFVLLVSALTLFPVVPRSISSEQRGFFDNGVYDGAMLSEQNAITLAPKLNKIGEVENRHIWKLYPSADGALYAAISGGGAELYKLDSKSSNFVLFVSVQDASAFTSVITDKAGNVYAASGPQARLYKYSASGTLLWESVLEDTYVWDMKFDKTETLYLASGGEYARVLRVAGDGKVTQVIKTEELHAMSLYYNEKANSFYVGTAGRGLILELNAANGNYKVLHDTAESEVHTITMDTLGNTYFGTSSREASSLILPSLIDSRDSKARTFRNSLYKADTNGTVQRLFYLSQSLVFALSSDKDNNIYFITGDNIDIYRIGGKDSLLGYVGGLKDKTISTFSADANGLYFAVVNTGEVYKFDSVYPTQGVFTSDALDMRFNSRYGSASILADTPINTSVKVETRTGNVARVDDTWSKFEILDPDGKIKSPQGRFLQFRITMTTQNTNLTPILNTISFSYVPQNIAPEVLNGRVLSYYQQQTTSNDALKRPTLSQNDAMLWWSGSDANGDSLVYHIDYRLKGEANYRTLATNVTRTYFVFEASKLPAAIYDFRITASDRMDNNIDESLMKSLDILNVKYDNIPPVIEDFKVTKDGNVRVAQFSVVDSLSLIRSVRYATITSDWNSAKADDNLIDSAKEAFTVAISDGNASSITLEVSDMEGNTRNYSFILSN